MDQRGRRGLGVGRPRRHRRPPRRDRGRRYGRGRAGRHVEGLPAPQGVHGAGLPRRVPSTPRPPRPLHHGGTASAPLPPVPKGRVERYWQWGHPAPRWDPAQRTLLLPSLVPDAGLRSVVPLGRRWDQHLRRGRRHPRPRRPAEGAPALLAQVGDGAPRGGRRGARQVGRGALRHPPRLRRRDAAPPRRVRRHLRARLRLGRAPRPGPGRQPPAPPDPDDQGHLQGPRRVDAPRQGHAQEAARRLDAQLKPQRLLPTRLLRLLGHRLGLRAAAAPPRRRRRRPVLGVPSSASGTRPA